MTKNNFFSILVFLPAYRSKPNLSLFRVLFHRYSGDSRCQLAAYKCSRPTDNRFHSVHPRTPSLSTTGGQHMVHSGANIWHDDPPLEHGGISDFHRTPSYSLPYGIYMVLTFFFSPSPLPLPAVSPPPPYHYSR